MIRTVCELVTDSSSTTNAFVYLSNIYAHQPVTPIDYHYR